MKNEKIIELAQKLKALADKGVGGEKETAAAFLKRLLEKHNLTESDLESEIRGRRRFYDHIKNVDLFWQIVAHVAGKELQTFTGYERVESTTKSGKRKTTNRPVAVVDGITLTEMIEIEAKFDFYQKEYEKQLKVFYIAFIQTNELYSNSAPINSDDLSEEERNLRNQARKMTIGMEKSQFLKRLNQDNG